MKKFIEVALVLAIFLLNGSAALGQVVTSNDPNFTPLILKSGLSFPDGVVFRPPTGDLLVSQGNLISTVNANSGHIGPFATQTSANEIAVRAGDGLVAVTSQVNTGQSSGPIDFYSSSGTFLGSLAAGTPDACIGGLAFDASGNLFVAAGPAVEGSCEFDGWAVYEFLGTTLLSPTPTQSHLANFSEGDVIAGLAFSATPFPGGSLYAVSSSNGNVYQIILCSDCDIFAFRFAQVSSGDGPNPNISGIAIDPLLGDIYISEFTAGALLRVPPPDNTTESPETPTIFATGFSNTLGLAFDTNGNLYVNETNAGNLWKFTRNSFATDQQPITQGQTNILNFTNPNPAMSDQTQSILIPASANFCDPSGHCAAFLQDIFVPVVKATLDARLAPGSQGDSAFFGGGPVPALTTCIPIPSASPNPAVPNCLVTVQKCYDMNHNPFNICPVQEPSGSTDLIQLKSGFAGPALDPATTAFLIDFDTPPNNQTLTDITIGVSADPTGAGGSKGICSQTFLAKRPVGSVDFSIAISPDPISLITSNPSSALVTVTLFNPFSSTVTLNVSDVPPGLTASLSSTSTPSTLTVGIASNATLSGITTIVGNLLATGCIDNHGIANALSSKLSAAQAALGKGQIQTAINVLAAFNNQIQAQAGKHITASCTTEFPLIVQGTATTNGEIRFASTNVIFSPATVLTSNVLGLITSLKASVATTDPITGFVVNSSGAGVQGATVQLLDSLSNPVATAVGTDATGFYYFASTGSLTKGAIYTVQVTTLPAPYTTSTPAQTFTWGGKGLAFNFTVQ
jgi:hypothetical protein